MPMDRAIFEWSRMRSWAGSGLLTSACVCVCIFSLGDSKRKKWFGIAAERTRRGMWLKMDEKDYHWEANWKWKQYLCGHTHLHCNGIFSMGTPSFISLFICSANINGFLASATILDLQDTVMKKTNKVTALKELESSWKASLLNVLGLLLGSDIELFFFFFFLRMGKTQPSWTWCKNILGVRGMEVSLRLKNRYPYNQLSYSHQVLSL